MKRLVLILALLVVATWTFANPKCPQDGFSMYWTGETRTEWGKLEKVYRCPSGHEYLVADNPAPSYSNPSYGVHCPLDGMSMYFTGKMHGMAKVYRDAAGHEVDVR